MKVLHVVTDEKFIDFFASSVNSIPGVVNEYLVWQKDNNQPLQHIKKTKPYRCVNSSYLGSSNMVNDLSYFEAIVIHYMTAFSAKLILAAPKSMMIGWSGWGQDYYDFIDGKIKYGPVTSKILTCLNFRSLFSNPKLSLKAILGPALDKYRKYKYFNSAFSRVTIFSAPVVDDFHILKKSLGPAFKAKYAQLNYGSVEDTFSVGVDNNICGNDILLGNSSAPTNNHIEIIYCLQKIDLGDRKVIVPLSYGGSIEYRNYVIELGERLLGSNFVPIIDFMTLSDYNVMLSRCSIAIMNHYRQQALGNIGVLMLRGVRIFINPQSVLFDFFSRNGMIVSSIDQLFCNDPVIFQELSEGDVKKNIDGIKENWDKAKILMNNKNFLMLLNDG